jgi:hypothetical protein
MDDYNMFIQLKEIVDAKQLYDYAQKIKRFARENSEIIVKGVA